MLTKNDALANRGLDCIYNGGAGGVASIALLDGGTSEFRSLPKPSNPNAAATGTLVALVNHEADASSAAGSRTVNMIGTMQDLSADNDGLVAWVRSKDATGTMWHDQTCGQQGPSVAISNTALVGGLVQITANAHGLANADQVEIVGNGVAAINGKWQAFNVTLNTFQILSTDVPGVGGTARKTFDVVIDNADLKQGQKFIVQSMAVTDPI